MKKALRPITWSSVPKIDPLLSPYADADDATDAALQNQRKSIHYTIRKGLKIDKIPKRKTYYNTAHRQRKTVASAPAMSTRWTDQDESQHEVKAHIRDTAVLLQSHEWDALVGKGITNLVIEDDDNVLKVLPSEVANIQTLRFLTLMWSKIKVLPPHLFQMNLKELYIKKCALKAIDGIHHMTSLEILEVSNGLLKKLPMEIGNMTTLKKLDVTGNKLNRLPSSMNNLQLESLILCGNALSSIQNHIAEMTSLVSFDASQNQIKELPANIGSLTNLVTLRMSHNQLSSLPQSTRELHNLKNLFLGNNLFTNIPDVLAHTIELQTLNLVGNQIYELSTPLPHLTTLLLDKNILEVLQPPLFGCVNLEKLSLQYNHITSIPSDIKRLTKLRALYLGGNDITKLPDELCKLSELRHLVMRETKVQELPMNLDSLRKLSVVDLSSTNVSLQCMYALKNNGVPGLMEHVRVSRASKSSASDNANNGSDVETSDNEIPETEQEKQITFNPRSTLSSIPGTKPLNRPALLRKDRVSSDDDPFLEQASDFDDGASTVVGRRLIKTMILPGDYVKEEGEPEPLSHQSTLWLGENKSQSNKAESIEMKETRSTTQTKTSVTTSSVTESTINAKSDWNSNTTPFGLPQQPFTQQKSVLDYSDEDNSLSTNSDIEVWRQESTDDESMNDISSLQSAAKVSSDSKSKTVAFTKDGGDGKDDLSSISSEQASLDKPEMATSLSNGADNVDSSSLASKSDADTEIKPKEEEVVEATPATEDVKIRQKPPTPTKPSRLSQTLSTISDDKLNGEVSSNQEKRISVSEKPPPPIKPKPDRLSKPAGALKPAIASKPKV